MKHKAKALTKEEVMKRRSSAYKFIDLTEPPECPICGTPFFSSKCNGCGYKEQPKESMTVQDYNKQNYKQNDNS